MYNYYVQCMYIRVCFLVDGIPALEKRMSRIEDTQHKILEALGRLEGLMVQKCYPTINSCSPMMDHFPRIPLSPNFVSGVAPSTPLLHATPPPVYFHQSAPATSESVNMHSADQDPLPLSHQYSNRPLPSTEIERSNLISVDYVLRRSKGKSSKPGTLTQMLARDSFFGESLMARCTPRGTKDLPALPKKEMCELKKTVFQAFPNYSAEAFETEWKSKCWPAIEQACGRLRRAARNKI